MDYVRPGRAGVEATELRLGSWPFGTAREDGPVVDRGWSMLDAVRAVSDDHDATPERVAIRWATEVAGVTALSIREATSVAHVEEHIEAVDLVMKQDDRIARPGRASGVPDRCMSSACRHAV